MKSTKETFDHQQTTDCVMDFGGHPMGTYKGKFYPEDMQKLAGENRRLREALQELFSATKVLYFSQTFQEWDKQLSPEHDAVVTAAMNAESALGGEPVSPGKAGFLIMTPEQIVQKWAEHIEDTLFNDEWLGTNEVGCVELLETLMAELQPLADLIRAAQNVLALSMADDDCKYDAEKELKAALDNMAGD